MALEWEAGALAASASGVAMAGIGLVVLGSLRPLRRTGLAFSLFAMLWGVSVVAGNMLVMSSDAATAQPWLTLAQACTLPLFAPLLAFALGYPEGSRGPGPGTMAGLALLAGTVVLFYLAVPTSVAVMVDGAGGPRPAPGPLFVPASSGNLIGAFAVALVLSAHRLRKATIEVQQSQLSLVVAAFSAYLSYRAADAVNLALLRPGSLAASLGGVELGLRLAFDLAAAAAVAYAAAPALRDRHAPWRSLRLFCAAVPFAFGVGELLVNNLAGISSFYTVGLWRLFMVALFAYAIARTRLFDLEGRLGSLAPASTYALAVLSGVAALWVLAGEAVGRTPLLGAVATVGVVAGCLPAIRLGRAMVQRAVPHLEDTDYLYQRKVEVYRAAVEEAAGRAMGDKTEQAFLSDLRRRLGISEREHKLINAIVQAQRKYAPVQRPDLAERFRVEKELGRGGTGVAKLAYDLRLDRRVVLKQPLNPWVLDPQGRKLFLAEAKLGARIQHPNVVTIYEVLPDEEPPVLVMEYVDGASLDRELRARGKLPPEEATRIALEVLAALERIHAEGIVHRDLKPGNILLARDGTAKVTDFGVAKPPPGVSFAVTALSKGGQPGTLAYMAPEQVQDGEVDARTDLYALAAVLFECLVGKHYLGGTGDVLELRRRILAVKPRVTDPAIPAALRGFLTQGLAKDPEERFPSARAMGEALRGSLGAKPRTRPRAARVQE